MKLQDKVAVVTGGGRGLGKAICLAMADEGANVMVAADVEAEVARVTSEINEKGRRAVPFVLDITNSAEVESLVRSTVENFGRVDILVNNAGVIGKKRMFMSQMLPSDDRIWRNIIEVNLFGTYNCIRHFLPELVARKKGRIINIASISGKQASATNAAYAASKHAVIGITRSVAAEMGMLGFPQITVNAVCPGVANTGMLTGPGMILDEYSRIFNTTRERALEDLIKRLNIQRRVIEPEEVAGMAVYLASDDARGITGQAINVCGGTVFY